MVTSSAVSDLTQVFVEHAAEVGQAIVVDRRQQQFHRAAAEEGFAAP